MLDLGSVHAGLSGAIAYGCADFLGGRASRRLDVSKTVAIAQCTALLVTVGLVSTQLVQVPELDALALSVLAGLAYAAGLMLLYGGFAQGRIGIVAPMAGLVGVLVPVLFDVIFVRRPSEPQLLGLALAAVSVVLLGASSVGEGRATFSIQIGAVSGLGYGIADLILGSLPAPVMGGSLCVIRLVAALCAILVIAAGAVAVRRRPAQAGAAGRALAPTRSLPLPAIGLAVLAGMFDSTGHQSFAWSAATGQLALAAALVALHPLVSLLLAAVVLKERIRRLQYIGSASGITSMVMLSL